MEDLREVKSAWQSPLSPVEIRTLEITFAKQAIENAPKVVQNFISQRKKGESLMELTERILSSQTSESHDLKPWVQCLRQQLQKIANFKTFTDYKDVVDLRAHNLLETHNRRQDLIHDTIQTRKGDMYSNIFEADRSIYYYVKNITEQELVPLTRSTDQRLTKQRGPLTNRRRLLPLTKPRRERTQTTLVKKKQQSPETPPLTGKTLEF